MLQLKTLKLENFRNFQQERFEFGLKTAVIGNNGVGKSNILEAIRLLSIGKSFKSSRVDDALRFNEMFFRLRGTLSNKDKVVIDFFYGQQFSTSTAKERRLTVDGQERGWTEFWGSFPTTLFVPGDIDVVIGPPQNRRRYLDAILWQTSREFRRDHMELTKVLRERSALLFQLKQKRVKPEELNPWTSLLIGITDRVRRARREFVDFLILQLPNYDSVFASNATLSFSYQENGVDPDMIYNEEVRLSQNLVGPHRDDLEILFNDQVARRFTSRGQARAIAVILKVVETAYITSKLSHPPVVLLDDMFSELDQPTAEKLFGLFSDYQIIATSISKNSLLTDWKEVSLL